MPGMTYGQKLSRYTDHLVPKYGWRTLVLRSPKVVIEFLRRDSCRRCNAAGCCERVRLFFPAQAPTTRRGGHKVSASHLCRQQRVQILLNNSSRWPWFTFRCTTFTSVNCHGPANACLDLAQSAGNLSFSISDTSA